MPGVSPHRERPPSISPGSAQWRNGTWRSPWRAEGSPSALSLLAPGLLARMMTGGDEGGTRLFVRMIGARDLGVGLGLQVALDRDAPTRGWLEAHQP